MCFANRSEIISGKYLNSFVALILNYLVGFICEEFQNEFESTTELNDFESRTVWIYDRDNWLEKSIINWGNLKKLSRFWGGSDRVRSSPLTTWALEAQTDTEWTSKLMLTMRMENLIETTCTSASRRAGQKYRLWAKIVWGIL